MRHTFIDFIIVIWDLDKQEKKLGNHGESSSESSFLILQAKKMEC